MATVNPWSRFRQLLPRAARYIVTVQSIQGDGTCLASRRDGETVRLKGTSVEVGKQAWVEGQQIIGEAPDLPSATQYI